MYILHFFLCDSINGVSLPRSLRMRTLMFSSGSWYVSTPGGSGLRAGPMRHFPLQQIG